MAEFNPRDIVYTPNDTATIGTEYLKEKRETAKTGLGVPLGIPVIDKDFIPAMGTELVTILGRPGCGKTSFMMRWARHRAKSLVKMGRLNRVVIYISFEQSIEELNAFNIAAEQRLSITSMAKGEITDDEWEKVLRASTHRVGLPLWFIGHSIARRKKRPVINTDNIALALSAVEGWNSDIGDEITIDSVFIDYLQRIPIAKGSESKMIGTSDNLDRLKDGAIVFNAPFIVGAQAKREVDERKIPIPESDDGQWTSNIEQASDKQFSVVRPRRYRKEGERFGDYTVRGNNQMLVTLLKQKLGDANKAYMIGFDPIYNKLVDLETRSYNPANDTDNTDFDA